MGAAFLSARSLISVLETAFSACYASPFIRSIPIFSDVTWTRFSSTLIVLQEAFQSKLSLWTSSSSVVSLSFWQLSPPIGSPTLTYVPFQNQPRVHSSLGALHSLPWRSASIWCVKCAGELKCQEHNGYFPPPGPRWVIGLYIPIAVHAETHGQLATQQVCGVFDE